jgi:hypothetical protein
MDVAIGLRREQVRDSHRPAAAVAAVADPERMYLADEPNIDRAWIALGCPLESAGCLHSHHFIAVWYDPCAQRAVPKNGASRVRAIGIKGVKVTVVVPDRQNVVMCSTEDHMVGEDRLALYAVILRVNRRIFATSNAPVSKPHVCERRPTVIAPKIFSHGLYPLRRLSIP